MTPTRSFASVVMLASMVARGSSSEEVVTARTTPTEVVTQIGAQVLQRQAWQTHARYVKAARRGEGDIPPEHWGDVIRDLKPHRVYPHRVNLVMVLQTNKGVEQGLYVCLPISSFMPVDGTDGFEFKHVSGEVYSYRRSGAAADSAQEGESEQTAAPRFGLYMPVEDVYTATEDVSERINQYLTGDSADIRRARHPIVSEEDIIDYDWSTHTLTLSRTFWCRIRRPSLQGSPFVIVANGDPIYVGAFFTDMSSFACPVPIIRFDERMTNKVIPIERAYPTAAFAGNREDPRPDPRIKNALQSLGKLRE